MKSLLFLLLILLAAFSTQAQNPPQTQTQAQTQSQPAVPPTDIYLLTLQSDGDLLKVNNPINITNHQGYDNQPFFLPDRTALLFTSVPPYKVV